MVMVQWAWTFSVCAGQWEAGEEEGKQKGSSWTLVENSSHLYSQEGTDSHEERT